jgi:hypothetical protein
MKMFWLLALALLAWTSQAAFSQSVIRTLPDDAKRGYLSHVHENVLSLDGKETSLAAGARIRGANNLIVMPAALPRDSLVKYQLDAEGKLQAAWVLTREEASKPDKDAGFRWPWQTSPEQGRPIQQVIPESAPQSGTTAR